MQRESAEVPRRLGAVVTVGTFDGLHRGHREVIGEAIRRARARGLPSVLITFEPHPLAVVRPEVAPRHLTTAAEKLQLLAALPLDRVEIVPFTGSFSQLAPEEFVRQHLCERHRAVEVVIGYNHGFGKGREGTPALLQELGGRWGFEVVVIGPVLLEGEKVSSSGIRRALERGDVERAAQALGRPYHLTGVVVPGAGRGRKIGFPTANLAVRGEAKCLPGQAVYAVEAAVGGGTHGGMAHLGPRPTFGEEAVSLEVHLFDFDRSIEGEEVVVRFLRRLRPIRTFASPEALRRQLEEDREGALEALEGSRREVRA